MDITAYLDDRSFAVSVFLSNIPQIFLAPLFSVTTMVVAMTSHNNKVNLAGNITILFVNTLISCYDKLTKNFMFQGSGDLFTFVVAASVSIEDDFIEQPQNDRPDSSTVS